MRRAPSASDTSSDEVFVLVDKEDAAGSPVERWSSRRTRLAGLLRPWAARRQALAPPAPAPATLSAIPILSLPPAGGGPDQPEPATYVNPLAQLPLEPASSGDELLQVFGLPASSSGSQPDPHAACDAWLQQLPAPLTRPGTPASHASSGLLSGMSPCTSEDGDGAAAAHSMGSFCRPQRPTAVVLPSSSSGGSSGGSTNDLLNLLMQQGEPTMDRPPVARQPPVAGAAAPAPAAAVAGQPSIASRMGTLVNAAAVTTNPLQQLAPTEKQAALLSWRRHACQLSAAERREPELLRRLLSSQGGAGASGEDQDAPFSSATAAGGGGARGRASGRHLLLLTAMLALMVLLLHCLHSQALQQHLEGEQAEQGAAAVAATLATHATLRAQRQTPGLRAAMLDSAAASAAGSLDYDTEALSAEQVAAMLDRRPSQALPQAGLRHKHSARFAADPAHQGRFPRFHLRRSLTLLLFKHPTSQQAAAGSGRAASASGGASGGGQSGIDEVVFEEWELSVSRK